MTDTVFRTPVQVNTTPEKLPEAKESHSHSVVDVEVPYLDYESQNSKPYTADYFELGDTWNDPAGGFPKEISMIESYIKERVNSGEIGNSLSAIKNEIKSLEKMNNLKGEERAVVRIEVLSAYIEFMQKKSKIKSNLRRYAQS